MSADVTFSLNVICNSKNLIWLFTPDQVFEISINTFYRLCSPRAQIRYQSDLLLQKKWISITFRSTFDQKSAQKPIEKAK